LRIYLVINSAVNAGPICKNRRKRLKNNAYHLTKNLKKATIPSTIQDVIMARVDKLPETAKELLQTGSVIEREFTHDLTYRVADLPEKELRSNLSILKTSEEIHDFFAFSQANFWYGCALGLDCQFDQASQCFEKALSISVAGNSLWGISVTKNNWAYYVYYQKGDSDTAYEISREALALAEESGDVFSKSWAYLAYGASCFAKGYLDEALDFNLKSVGYCDRIDALNANSAAQRNLALIHFSRGEYKDSEYRFSQAIAFLEKHGAATEWINSCRIGLAMARVMNNKKDIDLKIVKDYVLGAKIEVRKAWVFRFMAHIMLNIDKDSLSEAKYWIENAIEVDRKHRLMFYLGEDHALYADFFKRKGDQTKAKENLNKAIEIFKECNADGWVEKYEKEFAAFQ